MGQIKFRQSAEEKAQQTFYHAVFRKGHAYCSCGRPLEKLDTEGKVWRCSGGWPTYRLDTGDVFIDKFGELYLKNKPHA